MLKGRDIVVIGLQPWYYEIGSNCKSIATYLSKYNRVLYVNQPVNRKTFYSRTNPPGIQDHCSVIRGQGSRIRPVGENIWEFYPTSIVESINWLPSSLAFRAVNAINNQRLAKDISEAVKELGFHDIILFNDNDFFNGYNLKKLLKPSIYVYYCRDYLRGQHYWKKHGDVLEPALMRNADLVVANSMYLADYCAEHNKDSFYIGQGCNLKLFDKDREIPIPESMRGFIDPVIGYVGAVIADRLDENIIRIIAQARPEWKVVLVGPEDDAFKRSSLHSLPNVYFLGRKPLEELPQFVQCFDVCINPQLVNQLTIGNYPLKVDEYLAMGKPVVATRTRAMSLFEPYTYLAERPDEYPALIEQALVEDSPQLREQRAGFARTHTWENSVEALSERIIEKEKEIKGYGSSGRQTAKMGPGHREQERVI
jgi:glycosyltransferase involved in cell wall biosynthesis